MITNFSNSAEGFIDKCHFNCKAKPALYNDARIRKFVKTLLDKINFINLLFTIPKIITLLMLFNVDSDASITKDVTLQTLLTLFAYSSFEERIIAIKVSKSYSREKQNNKTVFNHSI
jgi:hypothetical protein